MLNANQEIVELYEQGLDVDAIVQETGYEATAIKSVLLQSCAKYRNENKLQPTEKKAISDSEAEELLAAGKQLALSSDNDMVRARMIMYLYDEHKGRNDRDTKKGNLNVSILMLNNALREARKVIDVETVA